MLEQAALKARTGMVSTHRRGCWMTRVLNLLQWPSSESYTFGQLN